MESFITNVYFVLITDSHVYTVSVVLTFSTRNEINMLEITYRFCVKYMQRVNKRTKTNICLASLGATNIEGFIDKAKLIFLRRLCTAPIHTCVKSLFLNRLVHYQNNVSLANAGFIHDVMRIVNKYCLSNYIDLYISDGYFVPKTIWKHIVNRSIRSHHCEQWSASTSNDLACKRFVSIHNSCNEPLVLWSATLRFPHKLCELSFLVQLCVSTHNRPVCELCSLPCNDFVIHFFCVCKKMTSNREHFWDFISRNYDINLEIELFNKSDDDFVVSMLGGKIDFFKYRSNDHILFLKQCATIWYVKLNLR